MMRLGFSTVVYASKSSDRDRTLLDNMGPLDRLGILADMTGLGAVEAR